MTLPASQWRTGAVLALGLIANWLVVLLVARQSVTLAALVAALPLIALAFGRLVVSEGSAVFAAALALPMSFSALTGALPLGGGHLYMTDIFLIVALAAWLVGALAGGDRPSGLRWPASPVLSWPLAIFGVLTLITILRGHESYGASLLGQPLRLFIYAVAGVTIGGLSSRRAYELVVIVFYTGTVWTLLTALYYVASGTSQTVNEDLSTGGSRVLAISTSLYMAGALFLALLNLQLEERAGRRFLHVAIALLALVGVALGFGRAVFAAVGLVVALIFLRHAKVRASVVRVLPLLLPVVLLVAFAAAEAKPRIGHAISSRIFTSVSNDANVQWREKANAAVWKQVRLSPVFGVGFGRDASFTLYDYTALGVPVPVTQKIDQDPHDGYMMLLAAGGVVLLASFGTMLLVFVHDTWRRLRGAVETHERILIVWAAATLFAFLFNAASGTEFESGSDLLTIWMLLLIPSVVPLRVERR